jgi:hypothetical protein
LFIWIVRWLARTISALAAVFWLLILLDIIACDVLVGFVCMNWEIALRIGLVVLSIFSVIIAWRWEWVGGIVMIFWGIAFCIIAIVTSSSQRGISILVSGVPFVVAGLLFLASSWGQGHTKSNRNPLGTA